MPVNVRVGGGCCPALCRGCVRARELLLLLLLRLLLLLLRLRLLLRLLLWLLLALIFLLLSMRPLLLLLLLLPPLLARKADVLLARMALFWLLLEDGGGEDTNDGAAFAFGPRALRTGEGFWFRPGLGLRVPLVRLPGERLPPPICASRIRLRSTIDLFNSASASSILEFSPSRITSRMTDRLPNRLPDRFGLLFDDAPDAVDMFNPLFERGGDPYGEACCRRLRWCSCSDA
jgi:hypothetical protein